MAHRGFEPGKNYIYSWDNRTTNNGVEKKPLTFRYNKIVTMKAHLKIRFYNVLLVFSPIWFLKDVL